MIVELVLSMNDSKAKEPVDAWKGESGVTRVEIVCRNRVRQSPSRCREKET